MKSTPATLPPLRIPAVSATSSPCTSPKISNEPYPWAAHTPENSPRRWGVAPAFLGGSAVPEPSTQESRLIDMWADLQTNKVLPETAPVEPVVSRDLLRNVCEPFFEQMLTALEQALAVPQKQQHNGCAADATIMQTMAQAKLVFDQMLTALPQALALMPKEQPNTCAKTVPVVAQKTKLSSKAAAFQPSLHTNHYSDPTLDLESTEAADSIDGDSRRPSRQASESDAVTPETISVAPGHTPHDYAKQSLEKNSMVCRHWRSKGWCRLHESGGCMFAHPEHKRGVAAPIAPHLLSTDDDKTYSAVPELLVAVDAQGKVSVTKRKKHRAGKKNRDKEFSSEKII